MAHSMKDDFLVKREKKADDAKAAEDANFTYFGPSGVQERFRFLVVREEGGEVSVAPITDAKFKVGLDAWRWKEREGGSPETYVVVKTTASRVDLKKA
jgi:hypothetical protein